jgi:BASS family bile acid:Na+ symporter
MNETLNLLFDYAVEIFVISTMLSLGLQVKLHDIIKPISNLSVVSRAVVCNFILIPAAAFFIGYILNLDPSLAVGLFLVGLCAGAPMLAKYADFAKADMAYAAALMVLLQVGTIIAVPLILPLFPIQLSDGGVDLDVISILKTLILSMLLPIICGMAIFYRYERVAKQIQPVFSNIASFAMVVLLGIGMFLAHKDLLGLFGSGAFIGALLLLALSFFIGRLFADKQEDKKHSFILACGSRNDTAAILISSQNMDDDRVIVMVLAFAIVMIIVNSLFASELGRRKST